MPYIGNEVGNRFVASKAASVYSGNGSTTAFTLEHAVGSDEDILVSVDGVIQEPSVAYAVSSGTTLTFTAAPSSNSGNNIFVYYLFRTVATVDHPSTSSLQATDGTFTAGITGILQTASQTNITSVGTLTSFRSTGIDDNADATAMTINSSENILIGKTSADNTTVGVRIQPDGFASFTRDGNFPLLLNRKSSDGTILDVRRDGTSKGGIGTQSDGRTYIANADMGITFNQTNYIMPSNGSGAENDNSVDLGKNNSRFKDLYLSGGAFIGGTGSANKLDDYEEGTFTASLYGTTSGSGTNVTTTGSYIKVGKHVTIGAYFQNVNLSSMSGSMNITGVPFTTNGEASCIFTGNVALYGFSFTGFVTPYIGNNSTTIDMLDSRTGLAWAGLSVPQAAGKYMIISLTYKSS